MELRGELHGLPSVARVADDVDAVVRVENRLQSLGEQPMVVRDEHADSRGAGNGFHGSLNRNVPCYAPFVKGDEDARERIHKLLVTGDNRLKQGTGAAKARQSYEAALALAVESGLEETVRPLVEIRLADLERLAGESPPPAPPAA